jgi:transcriptional regulator GlxA family with amidase domain
MPIDANEDGSGPNRRLRRLASEAQAFMAANLHRDLSLAAIARSVDLSAFYFSRMFREVTGVPPYRYLVCLRVARAKQLLSESELSVTQISARVGFRSANHFAVTFRRLTGMSPTRYRRAADLEAVALSRVGGG